MTQLLPPLASPAVGFVAKLGDHGDRIAVVDERGRTCTYAELDRRVDELAERLGGPRRLTMVRMQTSLDAIVGYLGALRAGHAVLVVDDGPSSDRIVEAHRPDVVIVGTDVEERHPATAHVLHPDLALLLSTSGSTGSPKLVRLSRHNVETNADAIARSLDLTAPDRAITTLPLHYCFGLSVLHSHLTVGASVVLNTASVVDPCFWEAVDRTRPTMLAAVPHTIDLLDRVGFPERTAPGLRAVIQAGGRLEPDRVRRWAEAGERNGWELFVMYGQTEATARMAYLPPALASSRPQAVGVAIPGGAFRVEPLDEVGEGMADGVGEIVYSGPNVMMGYAHTPADLSRGDEHDVLRTGDLGRLADDGLLEIVGRTGDFLKLFGLRIDLGRVRQHVADGGVDAVVDGDDDGITVAVLDDTDPGAVARSVADAFGLPRRSVAATHVTDVPRFATGKPDRATLRRLTRSSDAPEPAAADVRSIFSSTLAKPTVDDTDSFVSLGGDSLSYIEVSIALEQVLGHLPGDWHLRTVAELEAGGGGGPPALPRVETNVVLRAVAIVLIVGNHAGLFLVPGGAHVLFAAAGFNYGRFQSARTGRWRSVARIALPSMAWIGGAAVFRDDFGASHTLLVHGLVDGQGRWMYWFIEALVAVLLGLALLFSVPAVRRLERRAPFGFACGLLAMTAAPRLGLVSLGPEHHSLYLPQEIAWLFALGWALSRADTAPRRVALCALATVGVHGFFGDATREAIVIGGLFLLAWVPRIAVPRPLHRLVGVVASASLFIYLSHVQVFPMFEDPRVAVPASLLAGVVLWRWINPVVATVERHLDRVLSRARCNRVASGGAAW